MDSPLDYFDARRYPKSYLLLGLPEKEVQALVVANLRSRGCFVVVVDAGAAKLRGRAFGALRRAGISNPNQLLVGRTGIAAGLPDIIGCTLDGRFLAVECKAPARFAVAQKIKYVGSPTMQLLRVERAAGEATGPQLAFIREVRRRGGLAGVAWHPLDVQGILVPTFPSQAPHSEEGAGGPPGEPTGLQGSVYGQIQKSAVKSTDTGQRNRPVSLKKEEP